MKIFPADPEKNNGEGAMKVKGLFKSTEVNVDLQKRELRKACADFESLFVAQILREARLSACFSEEPDVAKTVYESMFDDAVAQAVAAKGVFGIGELLYEELVPMIERGHKAAQGRGKDDEGQID